MAPESELSMTLLDMIQPFSRFYISQSFGEPSKIFKLIRYLTNLMLKVRESWTIIHEMKVFNSYQSILQKIKNAGPWPSAFPGKIQIASLHHLYIFLCFGYFPGNRARSRFQKVAYYMPRILLLNFAYFFLYWHMPFESWVLGINARRNQFLKFWNFVNFYYRTYTYTFFPGACFIR